MMFELAIVVVGAGAFLAMPLFVGWQLVMGLRTGEFQGRFKRYLRATEPFAYWVWAGLHGAVILFFVGMATYVFVALRSI